MDLKKVNKVLSEAVSHLTEYFGGDESVADELRMFIDNDGQLYRGMTTSIHKALVTRKARGQYDKTKAQKAFLNLATAGAKKYAKDVGNDPRGWHTMFSMNVRKIVAKEMEDFFRGEMELGNYDHLLPKKYQKKK